MTTLNVTATRLVADEGSVVVFEGHDDAGTYITFGSDHRPAQQIVEAIEEEGEARVEVPIWAVLTRAPGI